MIYRELKPTEYDLLKIFLYEAIFIPEGVTPPDRSIIELPELRLYYDSFGSSYADCCIVAEDNGEVVGAAWSRIMDDYGHVDDDTPSLAMSVLKDYRGKGIGTRLLQELITTLKEKGYRRLSLSVQKTNYAVRMYEGAGFKSVKETEEEYIMVLPQLESDMKIYRIDQNDRKPIDDFIIRQWFSMEMAARGEKIDLGTADGWFACEEGEIVGLITYRIVNNEMEILSLDSLKENIGIGTMLLDKAISEAKSADCTRIVLITTNDNNRALRFYQKRGFDMVRLYINSIDEARKIKPQIPMTGADGIPIKHEIELELLLEAK